MRRRILNRRIATAREGNSNVAMLLRYLYMESTTLAEQT